MPPRVLETVLTGRNLLSPVLREAARDVRDYDTAVSQGTAQASAAVARGAEQQASAVGKAAAASTRAGQQTVAANRQVQESTERTSQATAASYQRSAASIREKLKLQELDTEAARRSEAVNSRAAQSAEVFSAAIDRGNLKIGRSSEQAAQEVAALRTELTTLGRTSITPGMDTADARVRLAELQDQLRDLDDADPSARVQAETAAASAQLRAIESQLNSIDGQSVRAEVRVNDNGSTTRAAQNIRVLRDTAVATSPAIGAIGAVAVAGLAGIAPLAASGAAGLGVLALGFSGVGDAVELLDQRQDAVAASAAQSAASQAASAQQVESAQASLANTQANAAAGAISAASRVAAADQNLARARVDAAEGVSQAQERAADNVASAVRQQQQAERTLATAQETSRRAQEDLTYARADARRELEDMNAELRNSALDEEDALINVERAQERLNEVIASGVEATALDRREAQNSYKQAQARLEDLRVRNARLADDTRVANAAGVDGAEQVVDARRRIIAAERSVADAARAAGEAAVAVDRARADGAADVVRAQRDGAEQIADAQRQVADAVRSQAEQQRQSAFSVQQAQKAVQAAMATTATVGTAALQRIDDELAEVGPSTLRFAEFWTDRMQPALQRVRETAAAGLLPGVQEGLESLLAQEPRITRFVDTYARSLGNLTRDSLTNLSSPQWAAFFDMLETDGVPQLESLWRSGDNVAVSLANIAVAFAPLSTDMAAGIEELSEDFAAWSAQVGRSQGFRDFEAYVRENWPRVREIIGNLADTVGTLIEAGAPIGAAYLQGFVLLTEVLSGLPVGVVQALLTAFIGYKAVSGTASIINGIARSIESIQVAAGRVGVGQLADIADGVGGIGRAGGAAAGGAGRFVGAAGGLLGVLGGPWGLAIGGAVTGLSLLTTWLGSSDEAAAGSAASQGNLAAALNQTSGAIDETVRRAAAEDLVGSGLNRWADDLGISVTTMTDALLGVPGAADQVTSAWKRALAGEYTEIIDANGQVTGTYSAQGEAMQAARDEFMALAGLMPDNAQKQREVAEAINGTTGALANQETTLKNMVGAADEQLGIYTQLLTDKTAKEQATAQAAAVANGDTSQSWRDHVASVDVSLAEYAAALDADVAKKDEWRADIKAVTERGGVEVGAALLAMGEEGARIADELANASDEDFRRMADSMVEHARNGGAAAAWELDQAMKIMTLASREGSKLTAQAIAQELGIGVADAARIAADYGIVLAGGINPLLSSLGKPVVQTGDFRARAGVVVRQAEGSVLNAGNESHVAQIAPAGAWRVWAEDETGGEAYIPLAPAKRHRSLDIWRETGRRLGAEEAQHFADGGLVALGREFQRRGATVSRHSAFDGRTPTSGHGRSSLHYTDDAIDVNTRPGTSALEQRELAPLMALARARGYRTIFMSAGHYNHGHVDNGGTPGSSIGQIGAAVAQPLQLPRPPSTAPYREPISTAADAAMQHLYTTAQAWVDQNTAVLDPDSPNAGYSGGGVERWRGTVLQALARVRQPEVHVGSTLRRMNQESGGNPRAINNWDINARRGTPSKGLMQVIDPTFAANRDRTLPNDIWDPLANITASMNYALKRYGSLPAAYDRKGGYDQGGLANGAGLLSKFTVDPERVLSPRQTEAFERWMDSPAAMPGYGAGAAFGGGAGLSVTVQSGPVRVYLDGQEWRGMARVEAETVVVDTLTAVGDRGRHNP